LVTVNHDAKHASSANNGAAHPAARSARRGARGSVLAGAAGVVAVLAGALSALWTVLPAGAVDATGQFELDGNIVQDAASAPPYDWGSLFNSSGVQSVTPDPVNGPLLDSTFKADTTEPDPTYFSSNKDIETVGQWGCGVQNNVLAKDDIQNAYAALFRIPANAAENAGHTVIFVGSERGSNNGNSFAGFWLFKDKNVGCNTSTGAFGGSHQVGDLLIVSNYTNGGGSQAVCVFRWTGVNGDTSDCGGGTAHNVPLVNVLDGGVCPTPPTGSPADDACAIANPLNNPDTPITSTWAPTSHPGNTFVEAGVDLTNLFSSLGGGDCFTNFMAETRSSQQVTATLKDFAGGRLNTCLPPPIATTATPGGSTNLPGASQHDVATLTGTPGKPAPTGTITFTLCAPADVTSAGCPTGSGTQVGTAQTVVSGGATSGSVTGVSTPSDLTPGKYCWRADYTPDTTGANNYVASSHTNATTECFTIVKASPTIATQIQVTGNGGLVNTSYGDQATLSSFTGTVTGETITFKLWGPYAAAVTPTCTVGTNEPVFTTTGTLNASGVATTSSTYTPAAAGTYVWTASYPGDTLNHDIAEPCNGDNETGTISPPVIHVTKTHDAATVSAGQAIGYTVTVANTGTGNATGVTLTDAMPGGNSGHPVHWAIDATTGNPSSFSITGADGSQSLVLVGQPISLGAGSSLSVHVIADTTPANCTVYDNSAAVATTNSAGDSVGPVAITVQCPNLGIQKTATPVGPVSTGDQIGFTVVVSNSGAAGTGTALAVTVNDPLPAGSGINWSISPVYGGPGTCSITGPVGAQVLGCALGNMLPGASATVAIVSATTGASAGSYSNTATAQASNNPPVSSTAGVVVLAPGLNVIKQADADSVVAGSNIGFTVTATNAGPGIAGSVTINDPLPGASGVSWSISPAYSGPGTCTITSSASGQTLTCSLGDMAVNATASVHVTSATTTASCTTFPNTATGSASNQGNVTSSATTTVTCPVSQVQGIISVPVTGAGLNLRSALGLISSGLVLLVAGAGIRRRRRRTER
jgi:uncharacterized repeat protein (TIGR01451 family)